jgi:hypothetical protein
LPSNSPSLAWVGFAVLALAVAGGLGGLYAHRQNQETTKRQLILDLEAEIEDIQERTEALRGELDSRIAPSQLKLAVRDRKLPLRPVVPSRVIQVPMPPAAATRTEESSVVLAASP